MKNIFIIWGGGLIGTHVVKEFMLNGDNVISLTKSGKSVFWEKALKWNRKNIKTIKNILKENEFDLVIDMIPFSLDDAIILFDVLRKYKIPLIACSSIDVYKAYWILWGTEWFKSYQKCPMKEKDSLRKKIWIEWMGYNKLEIEELYLTLPWPVTIIRLPAVYWSPDLSRINNYLPYILKSKKEIIIPYNKLNWITSRSFNKNCAFWIFLAKDCQWKNIYNIAEKKDYSEKEWIEKIWKIFHWKWKITEQWKHQNNLDFKQNWYVDSSKIRDELWFYEKYDIDEGLLDNILQYVYKKKNITYIKNY